MRKRISALVILSGALLVPSAGCRKAAAVRAPTTVVAEEPERTVVRARGGSEEQEPPAAKKDMPPEPESFHFPDDPAGRLLSKELAPSHPLPEPAPAPRRMKPLSSLDSPELPLPPSFLVHTTQPTAAPHRTIRPRLVTPDPLMELALEVGLPETQALPVGERTKQAGPDVNRPAPLPILGRPVLDRASLGDATSEASGAAVVAAKMPVRQTPVPFQRQVVPDPFENYRPLRLPVPAESVDPVTAAPRTP